MAVGTRTPDESPPASVGKSHHRRIGASVAVVATLLLGVLIVVISLITGDGNESGAVGTPVASEFVDVTEGSMSEVTELDGTLGFREGDPVISRLDGTITAAAEAGTTVGPGDVLYEVDGEPVVLLLGAIPAFRSLELEEETAVIAARSAGTLTGLPGEGDELGPGSVVYEVDGSAVGALPGTLPAWRALRAGITGGDVLQLESALDALGYNEDDIIAVDDEFTSNTGLVVERWQEAIGADIDGRLDLGEFVFLPEPVVVDSAIASIGDRVADGAPVLDVVVGTSPTEGADVLQLQDALAGLGYDIPVSGIFDEATRDAVLAWQADTGMAQDGTVDLGEVIFLPAPVRVTGALLTEGSPVRDGNGVLATSSSNRVVAVNLPADDQDLFELGDELDVEFPDGTVVRGVVSDIAGVATRTDAGTVFASEIVLTGTAAAGLEQAPVEVGIVTDFRERVLSVPVVALLALAEGGYAIEVETGSGATSLLGVEPGLFADGRVEVSGTGLTAGMRVVVP